MVENQKKINTFFLIFFLIPFFKPDIVASFSKLNYLFLGWQIIGFMYFLVCYIKNNKVSIFVILFLLFYLTLFISTVKSNGNIMKYINSLTLNLGLIIAMELYIKKDKLKILRILSSIFYVITIMNTLSFIIFPEGLAKTQYLKTPIYLLGIDNRFAFTYIPGLCIIGIYDILKNDRITKYAISYFLITFMTFAYFWSAGALVSEFLFILYYIFIYNMKVEIPTMFYFVSIVVSFIAIVFLRVQNMFEFLIVDILHKDLTFSNRTIIWDKSIKILKQNKIFGVGVRNSIDMIKNITAFHSHSDFLNILLQSGILGLGMYLLIIFKTFSKLGKYKKDKISQLISFTLFVMFVMLLVDTFDITGNLFMLLCLGYNIFYIRKGEVNYE